MTRYFSGILLVVSLAAAGCDPFATQERSAARAAEYELDAVLLGELLGAAPQFSLTADAVRTLANLWIDFTLLADRSIEDPASLRDSQTIAAATWHTVARLRVQQMYAGMVEARGGLIDSAGVDSAYSAGDVRYLQHVLIQVEQNLSEEDFAQRRNRAAQVERLARAGADFGALAAQFSDDSASAAVGGYLGLVTRGQTVPSFEAAAWRLPAGATSGIVETEFGYHLIRRPPLREIRDAFDASVHELLRQEMEALYTDSLRRARPVHVKGSVPAAVRGALGRFDVLAGDGRTLATYPGGSFTLGDFVNWVRAFAPQAPQALTTASNEDIEDFVEGLAESKVLFEEPDRRQVGLDPEDWDRIQQAYGQQLDALQALLGVATDSVSDAESADGAGLVEAGVLDYLRGVLTRQQPLAPPLVFLASALRDRYEAGLEPAGVRRAYLRAREVRATDVETIDAPAASPTSGAETP